MMRVVIVVHDVGLVARVVHRWLHAVRVAFMSYTVVSLCTQQKCHEARLAHGVFVYCSVWHAVCFVAFGLKVVIYLGDLAVALEAIQEFIPVCC